MEYLARAAACFGWKTAPRRWTLALHVQINRSSGSADLGAFGTAGPTERAPHSAGVFEGH